MIILSPEAVRGLMIAAQGLDHLPPPPATKDSILAAIRRMHMLQIDSINVIARAPYYVLWTRLGDYNPQWLDELLEEGALFEYWSNANCFLPMEDYPLYRAGSRIVTEKNPGKWLDEHPETADKVMNRIRTQGETLASDFVRTDGQKGDWWNWKEEKVALEYLYFLGEIMVRRRHNFQRVYDLRERVYPEADKLPSVSLEDAHDQFVLKTVQALGVTRPEWIANYFRMKQAQVKAALKRLEARDQLMTVLVENWDSPGYIHPDHLEMVEAAADGAVPQSRTTFLSPFDPLVWDGRRVMAVFDFDFFIEFYFPEPKRKYGYFSLPILYNNALIGRLDPKAHRKERLFEVKALHLEPGVVVDDVMITEIKRVLKACAMWHDTPQVVVRHATEPDLIELLSD
ncbi:MAG: crosslink repair DNA glycosylase YcaQ family protein [Anaerolineae bacterium]